MQLEIQMALNFVISYMYNKLPRRRVNIFGEELEKALKLKFQGHWYPNKPMKGSAFRCLKTGNPIDPVLEIAARQAGLELREITENLPEDLAVWVDPGEVSYRIGEKGQIKILYSELNDIVCQEESLDKEVTKTFNPEAQCFNPIDNLSSALSNISLSPKSSSPFSSNSPTPPFKPRETSSPVAAAFLQKSTAPLTFTIASFAQTKFGSTKLKSNSKRVNRMSPTEFSNYIKQRQMIQQQQLQGYSLHNPQQHLPQQPSTIGTSAPVGSAPNLGSSFAPVSSRPQSLSPNLIDNVLFQNSNTSGNQLYNPWGRGMVDQTAFSFQTAFNDAIPSNNQSGSTIFEQTGAGLMSNSSASSNVLSADQLSNLNENLANIYPQSQYQHLLVAN